MLATEGAGGVLFQKRGELEVPVAYISRSFNATERRYSAYEKELYAIVLPYNSSVRGRSDVRPRTLTIFGLPERVPEVIELHHATTTAILALRSKSHLRLSPTTLLLADNETRRVHSRCRVTGGELPYRYRRYHSRKGASHQTTAGYERDISAYELADTSTTTESIGVVNTGLTVGGTMYQTRPATSPDVTVFRVGIKTPSFVRRSTTTSMES
mmetsp:Transcript_37379/g.149143  ORF Transcript_37379/g.149143 Transcript_37379/m.149143 type:complete len:213 (+) Transcript_37379:369-1007(+)